MCIRDSAKACVVLRIDDIEVDAGLEPQPEAFNARLDHRRTCLLYTSDAADERSSVDLGGRRIIKKKKHDTDAGRAH